MPELPEVHTTVEGLNRVIKGAKITDVWSSYNSSFHAGKDNIKNVHYFKNFREASVGAKFLRAERRGKNVLIHLSNKHTILIHMKMTGHLLYGEYEFDETVGKWRAKDTKQQKALQDPFNQHIRLVFTLEPRSKKSSREKYLAFSDLRKFGKVLMFPTKEKEKLPDLAHLGPEPLAAEFTLPVFKNRLTLRPNAPIKQVLMDQSIIAGIGNIYSDEILWETGVHPLSKTGKIPESVQKKMFQATKIILRKGIHFGGDSMSDYRNINGELGNFQNKHNVYRRTGKSCPKKSCGGTIERKKVGGRSAHFCPSHQKLFK